jgi:hypothetical protein
MPRRLLRKLTDVSNGEDFGEIKEKLESEHVPVTLHICTRKDVSFFRIYVDLRQLEQARRLLRQRHEEQQIGPDTGLPLVQYEGAGGLCENAAAVVVREGRMRGKGRTMNNKPSNRWDAFTPMELQALDKFFRSFADLQQSTADIGKLQSEIADAMQRREIPAFGPVWTRYRPKSNAEREVKTTERTPNANPKEKAEAANNDRRLDSC